MRCLCRCPDGLVCFHWRIHEKWWLKRDIVATILGVHRDEDTQDSTMFQDEGTLGVTVKGPFTSLDVIDDRPLTIVRDEHRKTRQCSKKLSVRCGFICAIDTWPYMVHICHSETRQCFKTLKPNTQGEKARIESLRWQPFRSRRPKAAPEAPWRRAFDPYNTL